MKKLLLNPFLIKMNNKEFYLTIRALSGKCSSSPGHTSIPNKI